MSDTQYQPTIDDMINLPAPISAQIAPDGRHVAYLVSKPDWEKNERITQIWLAGFRLPEPRQITFASQSSKMPRWSPDGKWLAFLSQREGDKTAQIYRIVPFGGEAQRLTQINGAIGDYAWSPKGDQIAFTLTDNAEDALKKRREKFGDFRIEDEDYQRARLCLLNVETRKVQYLTGSERFHISALHWSPDGSRIALVAEPSPDMKDYVNGSLYVFHLEGQEIQQLVETGVDSALWSPDGKYLAFTRMHVPQTYKNTQLCLVPVVGGEVQTIPVDLDENQMLQAWGPDGIYFTALMRTGGHLFHVNPENGKTSQLTPDISGWFSLECTFSHDYSHAACAACTQEEYLEIHYLDFQQHTASKLTDFNSLIKGWSLGEKETFRWISQDGAEIEGVLTKPVNFDPQQKYPLLVVVHGGPTWASLLGKLMGLERRFYPSQQWAAKGALILEPNYRGSSGYGEAFRSLNVRNLGVGDYWDVISGVDALIEKGWVDGDRVGSMGWSQGGYISAFITTFSDRFKAVSVGAGISNWVTYYVNTDIHPFTREYLGATPWEDMEIYQKTSPMTYLKNARTPTLIQHGEQDTRVPLPNAFELYQGLQDLGVEARLIVYPGMPHGTDKPRTQRQIMQSNFDWFNRWIWGEEPTEEEEKIVYAALAGGEKNNSEENLPVVERYLSRRVQDVYHWAKRDGKDFYLFSGGFGLVDQDFPMPPEDLPLLPEDVSRMAIHLTEILRDEAIRRLVFYTPPVSQNPWVLIYLGCLQVAAGLVGNVTIEHVEVDEEGW